MSTEPKTQKIDNEGRLHCENAPALSYNEFMHEYFIHGIRHRDDGPAVIWNDPNMALHKIEYWINGKLHRDEEIGPAQIFITNYKSPKPETQKYYYNNKLHRLTGPAVVQLNNDEVNEYWIDGKQFQEIDFQIGVLNFKLKKILQNKNKVHKGTQCDVIK